MSGRRRTRSQAAKGGDDEPPVAMQNGGHEDEKNISVMARASRRTTRSYFDTQFTSNKTSTNLLSSLSLPSGSALFNLETKFVEKFTKAHSNAHLYSYYSSQYRRWFVALNHQLNLCFFGVGSKIKLMDDFCSQWCKNGPLFIAHAYASTFSLGSFIGSMLRHFSATNFRGKSGSTVQTISSSNITTSSGTANPSFQSLNSYLEALRPFCQSPTSQIYVCIHNIDAIPLRSVQMQSLLSKLASFPSIRLICSIDHFQASLLWTPKISTAFNFLKIECSTFEPYSDETMALHSRLLSGTTRRKRGVRAVLSSLTPNHRNVLKVLLTKFKDGKPGQTISWNDWLSLCLDEMIVSGEMALRVIVRELIDHQVVKVQRLQGVDLYSIENPKELQSWIGAEVLGNVSEDEVSNDEMDDEDNEEEMDT